MLFSKSRFSSILFLFWHSQTNGCLPKMWLPNNSFAIAKTSFPWSFLHSTDCITIEIIPVIQFVCILVIAQLAEICSVSVMSYFEEKKISYYSSLLTIRNGLNLDLPEVSQSVCILASFITSWKTDLCFVLHGPLCTFKIKCSLFCVTIF